MTDLPALVAFAERMADAVRPVVNGYFRAGVVIDRKTDASPVTAADREAETVMRRMIEEAYPGHGIVGEEHGTLRADARFVWVLDPIDGTKSFVTGRPLFGTLIALLDEGVPVVGVIDAPALAERWVGAKGRLTTFNGSPVSTRRCRALTDVWLYATSPQMFTGADEPAFARLMRVSSVALFGADCYAYGLLANGTVDVVCEASMQPYDYCALAPVVAGAGGVITDWNGRPLGLRSDGRVLAVGDPVLHDQALGILSG